MAWTHIATVGNSNDAAGDTLDASGTLNVQAGDVLIGWAKVEGNGAADFGFNEDSGGEAFTMEASTLATNNDALRGQFGWRVVSGANATFRPRMTCNASRDFRRMIVHQFRPDSGDTISFEAGIAGIGDGTSIASGAVSPTGTDLVAVGGFGEFTNTTTSSEQINGVAATEPTGSPQAGNTSSWYRILSSGFTSGQATATTGSSAACLCSILVLKAVAGAASYTITAEQGSYSLTGQDASLVYTKGILAEHGNYSLTGQDANLLYSGGSILMDAVRGLYSLDGQVANLFATRYMGAEHGLYNLTGEVALVDVAMFAENGTYVLSGQEVNLITPLDTLIAESGSYVLSGQSINLSKGTIMIADGATYAMTGQDASLLRTRALAAETGFYTYSGINISASTGRARPRTHMRRFMGRR